MLPARRLTYRSALSCPCVSWPPCGWRATRACPLLMELEERTSLAVLRAVCRLLGVCCREKREPQSNDMTLSALVEPCHTWVDWVCRCFFGAYRKCPPRILLYMPWADLKWSIHTTLSRNIKSICILIANPNGLLCFRAEWCLAHSPLQAPDMDFFNPFLPAPPRRCLGSKDGYLLALQGQAAFSASEGQRLVLRFRRTGTFFWL